MNNSGNHTVLNSPNGKPLNILVQYLLFFQIHILLYINILEFTILIVVFVVFLTSCMMKIQIHVHLLAELFEKLISGPINGLNIVQILTLYSTSKSR